MTRYAVVVDPLSTGQEFAAAFAAEGVQTVAVLSSPEVPAVLAKSWHPEDYAAVHVLPVRVEEGGDVSRMVETLRGYDPICLIPGTETGVMPYEAMLPLLLPGTGNAPDLASARRHKWDMARAVAAAGVPVLRQTFSRDEDEIAAWLEQVGLQDHDLVLKPANSGATDDVHLVPAGTDWRPIMRRIADGINCLDLRNEATLVQEFAPGPEFLVDSYSVDGQHGLVDVCRYTKFRHGDRIGIYDRVDFLDPDHPEVAEVWAYTRRVLDALGFRNGCGHAEIMLTPDGPRLIEIAERPAGGGHQLISRLATGDNHILRTVAHRVHGRYTPGYRLEQHVRGVFISAPAAGVWRNAEVFDGVDDLPTFWAKNFPHGTGEEVVRTDDLNTFLAWVILAGPDEAQIEADYAVIKQREAAIVIEPSAAPVPAAAAPAAAAPPTAAEPAGARR